MHSGVSLPIQTGSGRHFSMLPLREPVLPLYALRAMSRKTSGLIAIHPSHSVLPDAKAKSKPISKFILNE